MRQEQINAIAFAYGLLVRFGGERRYEADHVVVAARKVLETVLTPEEKRDGIASAEKLTADDIACRASDAQPARLNASDVDPTAGLDPNFKWSGDP
jgi:hypothetical protein